MQNKKIDQYVLIPIPLESFKESEINLHGVIETIAADGTLIIRNASTENFVCNNDCDNCPLSDDDCENRHRDSEVCGDD